MKLPRRWQLGLTFTNHHLRMALFDPRRQQIQSYAEGELPVIFDQMKTGSVQDLANSLEALRGQLKGVDGHRDVVISLGDEEVFTRILSLPQLPLHEAIAAAPHELESDLPLSADEMYVDMYKLRDLPDGQAEYMAFAVHQSLIDWLVEGAQLARLRPRSVETVSLSLGRLQSDLTEPFLTVDIGSDYASMAVFYEGMMHVNTSVAMHEEGWGELVGQATPRISLADLETQHRGLFDELTENIQATIRYFQNRSDTPREAAAIYLSGSGARVPHIDTLLNKQLHLPVKINRPTINSKDSLDNSFLPAVGASLYTH